MESTVAKEMNVIMPSWSLNRPCMVFEETKASDLQPERRSVVGMWNVKARPLPLNGMCLVPVLRSYGMHHRTS